jgi:hypothetical protein
LKARWLAAISGVILVLLLALWLARATIVAEVARNYFRSHGITADVEIGALGLSGVSGRFALGPADAPDISAERIELLFDPLRWTPYVTQVRLVRPVIRAQVSADGKIALGSLQAWLDSLRQSQGKSPYISDDLIVSLTGLRALLVTPAGAIEADGDVRLEKNLPASADLAVRPTRLNWHGLTAQVRTGRISYHNKGPGSAHVTADVQGQGLDLKALDVDFRAVRLEWSSTGGLSVASASASLAASDAGYHGAHATDVKVQLANLSYSGSTATADLHIAAGLTPGAAMPVLHTGDTRLDRALAANLAHLNIMGAAHLALQQKRIALDFIAPVEIAGAKGGALTVRNLQLAGGVDSLSASGFRAALHGGGLPKLDAEVKDLVWSGGGLTAQARLNADFDYAMLRRAAFRGAGTLSWQAGRYGFTPTACANISLTAFHPSTSDLAKDIRTELCGTDGAPLLAGEGAHWRLLGQARRAQAFLPLANSQIDDAAVRLDFEGVGADFRGKATVGTARMTDKTAPIRFKPMLGQGTAALAAGVWRGQLAMASEKNLPLGDVTFTHTMASGAGSAHIAAPKLTFAIDKLQPEDLSPLLVAFRRSEGAVDFQGDIAWTRDAITSRGNLAVNALDFLTPLGKAHTVKTKLDFVSLLPPQTAPGQDLTISRIDWTLPFSVVDLKFSFSPTAVKVDRLASEWAEGHAALTPFAINLADPGKVAGTADIKSINLENVIAASNLSNKVRLQGRISGTIPFTTGPDGVHIAKGHIAADGPGRLSVNRSVWAQGDAAISSNAVQDFAYQALENLAFESLSAELNSVANGRLQIVFHIKGRSDPPQHQTADVSIKDILNGTALYKPIPLPSGTPVDLTLDTSLNFDELLKSYAEAWSKTLSPEGQPASSGAKP